LDAGVDIPEYCREIETYLCRKNDGHLIRVVGPSFEIVSRWAQQGVPLKVACAGIDRYFERYYRSGPRRRPVKIDFCEADVLDVFDEWRRATGVSASATGREQAATGGVPGGTGGRSSLPAHLERVVARLTGARAVGSIDDAFDPLIDRVSAELDAARARPGGVRGDARRALLDRLAAIDAEMLRLARAAITEAELRAVFLDADQELEPFRREMADDAWLRAREAAVDRLVRERLRLPTVAFTA
jgi:hypothetical protein